MRVGLVVVVILMLAGSFSLGGLAMYRAATGARTGSDQPVSAQPASPEETPDTLAQSLPGYDPAVLPNFSAFRSVKERKRAFFNFLLPLIETANQHILQERREILRLRAKRSELTTEQRQRLHKLARKYRVLFKPEQDSFYVDLLEKVDVLPPSLILAQAAVESAWGTSRFAVEGNNLFGVWCFSKGCGLKPLARDADKSHEVKRYPTVLASIEDYLLNLNRHSRYAPLRERRKLLRARGEPLTGLNLISGLHGYAETGMTYIDTLASVIRHNRLERFDRLPSPVNTARAASKSGT